METKENHKQNALFEKKAFINAVRERGFAALTEMTQTEQVQVVNWAQDVFNQYRNVIDKHPEKIKSSADLPCHKEEIRIAIKTLLPAYLNPASKNTLQELKEKYVALASFQERDQPEDAVMNLVISEQKVLQDDINLYIMDLPVSEKDE
jgi:hypothetical protein